MSVMPLDRKCREGIWIAAPFCFVLPFVTDMLRVGCLEHKTCGYVTCLVFRDGSRIVVNVAE